MTTARETTQGAADLRTPLAFSGVVVMGGLNIVAARFMAQELPPFYGAALRWLLAGLVFLLLMAAFRIRFPRGRALVGSVLYGFFGFVLAFGLAYWALQELPAGVAGLIIAGVPLMTLVLAAIQGLERLQWKGIAGGLLAVAGVAVVLGRPGSISIPLLSALAMTGGALFLSQAVIVVKKYPPCHPVAMNAVGVFVGFAALLPISLMRSEEWTVPSGTGLWVALVYLVLFGTVGVLGLHIFVLNNWPASRAAYQFVLMPFVAAVAAALLLDETITFGLVIGGVIVLAGVYLGALSSKPEAAPAQPSDQEALVLRCSTT